MIELPDENDPYVAATNILRDIQDSGDVEYNEVSVFILMVQAFFAGVEFERDAE